MFYTTSPLVHTVLEILKRFHNSADRGNLRYISKQFHFCFIMSFTCLIDLQFFLCPLVDQSSSWQFYMIWLSIRLVTQEAWLTLLQYQATLQAEQHIRDPDFFPHPSHICNHTDSLEGETSHKICSPRLSSWRRLQGKNYRMKQSGKNVH